MIKKLINYLQKKQVPLLEGYFPSFEGMNKNQQRFYKVFKKNLDQDKALELENNIGYIFVYLYEILDVEQPYETINNLQKVQNLYKQYEKVDLYCKFWISDCYVLLEQIQNAIDFYPQKISGRSSAGSDNLLSLKLHLGKKPNGMDLLSLFGPKVTKSFSNDIEKIKILMDERIVKDYKAGNDLLVNWSKKISPHRYSLFVGSYQLSYSDSVKAFSFSLIPEVEEYVRIITRDAENLIRESKKMPRVGEGWISETKLFYFLKENFPEQEIIQHASPDWLGRQHLDIFFPEINLAIEYQGVQHDRPIDFFGGEKAFEEVKRRDRRKKRLCKKNNIRLFEVRKGFKEEDLLKLIKKYLQ